MQADDLRWGSLADWSQLVRLPAVFTLISNCIVTTIITVGKFEPWTAIVPIFSVSILAYWAGMILNDCHDVQVDRQARPDRPLAAGRISPAVAGHVATGMLMIGPLILLLVAAYHESIDTIWMGCAIASSLLLWVCIRAYNSVLKTMPLGPVLMGACRGLNILMVGFSLLAVQWGQEYSLVERFPKILPAYALAIAVYILGVTTYARREAGDSAQSVLALGTFFELAGLVSVAVLTRWEPGREMTWYLDWKTYYPVLVGLIGLTVINRAISGVVHPISRRVQLAVRHALLSLILIDAAIGLMWAGPWFGAGIAMLLLPAVLGAMRVRVT